MQTIYILKLFINHLVRLFFVMNNLLFSKLISVRILFIVLISLAGKAKANLTETVLQQHAERLGFNADVYHRNHINNLVLKQKQRFYKNTPQLTADTIDFIADIHRSLSDSAQIWYGGITQFSMLDESVKCMQEGCLNNPHFSSLPSEHVQPETSNSTSIWMLMLPWYTQKSLFTLSFENEKLSDDSFVVNPDLTVNFYHHHPENFFNRSDCPDVLLYVENRAVYLTFKKQPGTEPPGMLFSVSEYSANLKAFIRIIEKALIFSTGSSSSKQAEQRRLNLSDKSSDAVYLLPGVKGFMPVTAGELKRLPEASLHIMSYACSNFSQPDESSLNVTSSMVADMLYFLAAAAQARRIGYNQLPSPEFKYSSVRKSASMPSDSRIHAEKIELAEHLKQLKLQERNTLEPISCFDRNIEYTAYFKRYYPELMARLEEFEEVAETSAEMSAEHSQQLKLLLERVNESIMQYIDSPPQGICEKDTKTSHIKLNYLLRRLHATKKSVGLVHESAEYHQHLEKLKQLVSLEVQNLSKQEQDFVRENNFLALATGNNFSAQTKGKINDTDLSVRLLIVKLQKCASFSPENITLLMESTKLKHTVASLDGMYDLIKSRSENPMLVKLFTWRVKLDAKAIYDLLLSKGIRHTEKLSDEGLLAKKILTKVGSFRYKSEKHVSPQTVLLWNADDLLRFWEEHHHLETPKKEIAAFFKANAIFILSCFQEVIRDHDSDIEAYKSVFIQKLKHKFPATSDINQGRWRSFNNQFKRLVPTPEITAEKLTGLVNSPEPLLIKRAKRLLGDRGINTLALECAQVQLAIEYNQNQRDKTHAASSVKPDKLADKPEEKSLLAKAFITNADVTFEKGKVVLQSTDKQVAISSEVLRRVDKNNISLGVTLLDDNRQWSILERSIQADRSSK